MYAQIGNIRFDKMVGFDGFAHKLAGAYAEHARIEGKPRLQKIGDALDAITIGLQLHQSFVDVEGAINSLKSSVANGDILPFIDGKGVFVGNFVIADLGIEHIHTYPDGTPMLAQVSVTLKESIDEGAASNSGFASVSPLVNYVAQSQSSEGALIEDARGAVTAANTGIVHVQEEAKGLPGAFERADKALKACRDKLTAAQAKVAAIQSTIDTQTRILNDINRLQNAVKSMRDNIALNDLPSALSSITDMQNGVSALNGGLAEVAVLIAIRK